MGDLCNYNIAINKNVKRVVCVCDIYTAFFLCVFFSFFSGDWVYSRTSNVSASLFKKKKALIEKDLCGNVSFQFYIVYEKPWVAP